MENCGLSKRNLFLKSWIILCMIINSVLADNSLENLSTCELEALVKEMMNPSEEYQMHAAALRSQLRNLLESAESEDYQALDPADSDYLDEDKRSVSALARHGLLNPGKRYIASLARSGMLRRDLSDKRSIATLAKNGQLPSREPDADSGSSSQQWEEKRSLSSLARSGYLSSGKRNLAALARDYQLPYTGKRNIASLVRLGLVPSGGGPKRSVANLARLNKLPNWYSDDEKRNIGAMARDWSLPNHPPRLSDDNLDLKRNIGALKNSPVHGSRQKRDTFLDSLTGENYEIPEPVMQVSPLDYEELQQIYGSYGSPNDNFNEEKRFLGSLARSGGWFAQQPYEKRSDFSNYDAQRSTENLGGNEYRQQQQKRHIGALARSGWLPSAFRPVRGGRFSRSGRTRSRIVEYYPQQERLRQPIAAVCRRCDDGILKNRVNWGAPGLQSTSWGTPPRLTALHWRSLRPTESF